jgi:uncharacterized membrane protein (DUF485 family)
MTTKEEDAAEVVRLAGKTSAEIIASPEFKALVARRWLVSIGLTLALFVLYYGFILLVALDKPLMTTKVGEYMTLAIPMGIGVIVLAWGLTAVYVVWANAAYDPKVEEFKKKLKK